MSFLLALAALGSAQSFNMQAALVSIKNANNLPAMGCAVVGVTTPAKVWVTGVRKVGNPAVVQVTDHWHLGSDTKAMTAALVAMYVQSHALSYSTKVGTLFGLTPDSYYHNATLDNLLHMTAWLDHDPVKTWWYYEALNKTEIQKRQQAANDMLTGLPTEAMNPPYHYSNASYVFAGLAVEDLTKLPIETLLTQKIFNPLKMFSAAYGPNPANQPWPHVNGVPVSPTSALDNPQVMTAAGRVRVSLGDWSLWAREVMKDIRGQSSLLPAVLGQRLRAAPATDFYIDGWVKTTRSWSKGPVYNHLGSNTLNYADIWLAPTEGVAYMSVTNDGGSTAFNGCDTAVWTMISNKVQ